MKNVLVDLSLSRRLERTEAHSNASFVEARALADPAVGAAWKDVGGAWAMFDGAESPLTQTFGLGMSEAATSAQLESLESFFSERGAPVFHEVSPLADASHLPLLAARGYRPVEVTSVLFRELHEIPEAKTAITARAIARSESEADAWAEVSAAGWSETPALAEFVRGLGRIHARAEGTHSFVAERERRAIATGSMHLHAGVALLAGASTVPAERGRGGQRALLAARLQFAKETGCELAMMCAAPGSASQRNAERQGFRIAYTRIKWGRE